MSLKSAVPAAMLSAMMALASTASADEAAARADARVEAETGFWGRLFGGGKAAEERREAEKAQAEREREHQKAKAEKEREYHKAEAERAAQPGERGNKKGWVDGMPPGQAKKEGVANAKGDKPKGDKPKGDKVPPEARGADAADEEAAAGQPMTADEAIRAIAKDKAVRASGAASGSAEEALIEMGADIVVDKVQTY